MTWESWFTLAVIVAMVAALAKNYAADVIMVGAAVVFMTASLFSEAFPSSSKLVAGLGNEAVVTVAVLYVVVVLIAASYFRKRGVLLAAIACAVLTVGSFLLDHGFRLDGTAAFRCVVSLAAIVITIGRNRMRAASTTASSLLLPSTCCEFANWTIRMPFFATRPTSVTRPTCE